jgi:hypothetical protein
LPVFIAIGTYSLFGTGCIFFPHILPDCWGSSMASFADPRETLRAVAPFFIFFDAWLVY